jgi:hypothetical protein
MLVSCTDSSLQSSEIVFEHTFVGKRLEAVSYSVMGDGAVNPFTPPGIGWKISD